MLAVTVGCYLVVSAPFGAELVTSRPWRIVENILVVGAILVPVALVWLVVTIFLDAPQDRRPWVVLACLSVLPTFAADLHPWIGVSRGILLLLLYAGLFYVAISSAAGDLVQSRRRFRLMFLGAMALLGIVTTLVELFVANESLPAIIFPIQSGAYLLLCLLFGAWSLSSNREVWDTTLSEKPAETPEKIAQQDGILAKLEAAIEDEIWRREGLTIGALAEEIGVPEHRLRTAINQRLGYRNFPAFVNEYRIEAAKSALIAPENAGTTILEIAYDCGFASLGPFNKAFRAQTGQSPRDYRRSGMSEIPVDS